MSTLEFEGAIEDITENQYKFIGEVLEKRGFKNQKVFVEVVGVAGDNYMSNVRRLTTQNAAGKPFKMIVKIAPTIEKFRMAANTKYAFKNENFMYTEVLPKFKKMQIAAGVPKADMIKFAECYGSSMEEPHEVILLEDLTDSDFTMLDRFKSLSDDCIRSVLRNFAILHSLSYALKHKEPETYEKFRYQLYDVWSNMNAVPESTLFFEIIEKQALTLLSDDEQRTKILKGASIGNIVSVAGKLSKADADSKHNVIQQGDAWTNNIMFKFDGDTLVESIFIDYQLSKASKPVSDLMYMIFNCTDHQTRLKHYNEWIEHYHTELDRALSNFDLKANFVYSKDQLDVDLKRYAKVMFAFSVLLASMMTLKSEDAAMFKENMEEDVSVSQFSEKFMALDNVVAFKTKVEGLVDSFSEFGLL